MTVNEKQVLASRDPKFIEQLLKFVMPTLRTFFGCQVSGMERLGPGPHLLIANHNIGTTVEIFSILDAWVKAGRGPAFGLTHRISFRVPFLREVLTRLGAVPASFEAASFVLKSGASLLIFPGGAEEALRSFARRNECDFFNHRGWAKIALQANVPVVPISISGSHRLNPVLFSSRALAKFLILPKLLGLRIFPVTLAQIFFTALTLSVFSSFVPFGLSLGMGYFVFLCTPVLPVLPFKIRIKVGEPFPTQGLSEKELYHRVLREIQKGMDEMHDPRN